VTSNTWKLKNSEKYLNKVSKSDIAVSSPSKLKFKEKRCQI